MEARPWRDGKTVSYRYHPVGGKPIALGTNKISAIQKVLDLNRRSGDDGTFLHLWRLYQATPDFQALAESTQRFYRECWGRPPGSKDASDKGSGLARVFAHGTVVAVRAQDVARYLRVERADAPTTANREVALLSNLFNLAIERGEVEHNPCRQVRRNKERPSTELVERQDLAPFVEWALTQGPTAVVLASMAEFAALSGNRRIEFQTLHWPQVDDDMVRMIRGKQRGGTVKRELLARSEALDVVLARMKALPGHNPLGPVFAAPRTGNPYSSSGFKAVWGRLMDQAVAAGIVGTRFTFHALRAHYTTYYKRQFGALPDLHANPATTARVYERSGEVRRKAL